MADMEAVFDSKEVRDFLKGMGDRLKDVKDGRKKFVGLLSAIVYGDVMDHFEKEKGPEGKWKAWSDIYRKHMATIGRGENKMLQFNGRLRQNFKPTDVTTSNKGITWFNDAVTKGGYPFAWGHNAGDRKLPQREFMWLSDKALEEISEQTLQFMIDEGV